METAPLKSFATAARTELIREVGARITAVFAQGSPERVEQPKAVTALERAIAGAGGGEKGKAHVADKVAYTWFNRIIALRFMDANGYTGIGVVSPATDQLGQPEVLAAAKRGQLDADVVKGTNSATVTGLLNGTRQPRPGVDAQAEAYALLLADYCRFWNTAMPFMFEREGDFTELLIPANLLAEDSVLSRSVTVLTEEVCQDVEVIGWLYQFYISERKDEVFAGFKKNKKAGADEIPAATQLFTPHWIVRYLVENSLGRLWMLNRPSSGLARQMDYYIAPVDGETDFLKISTPEELKVIDPACGSGHMLTYAFDLLYAIYEEEGYAPSEIPSLILAHNLYGTEIDPRAGALAAFALTMKAVARRKLFLKNPVTPSVCVVEPISFEPRELEFLLAAGGDKHAEAAFWNQFQHADTLGALIEPDPELTRTIGKRLEELDDGGDLFSTDVLARAHKVVRQADALSRRHNVLVANPPYMGSANMDGQLSAYVEERFAAGKGDLMTAFMLRAGGLVCAGGIWGMINIPTWMFLSAYRKLREGLLSRSSIANMLHLGRGVFGADFGSVAFVVETVPPREQTVGVYRKLFEEHVEIRSNDQIEALFRNPRYHRFVVNQADLSHLPGAQIAYWIQPSTLHAFSGEDFTSFATPRIGIQSGNNEKHYRYWFEVSARKICRDVTSISGTAGRNPAWVPLQRGGDRRRWYGNVDSVVNLGSAGSEILGSKNASLRNVDSYFQECVAWNRLSNGRFYPRYVDAGTAFDDVSPFVTARSGHSVPYLLGLLASKPTRHFLGLFNQGRKTEVGHVASLPWILKPVDIEKVERRVDELVTMARADWNRAETSLDFAGLDRIGGQAPQLVQAWARGVETEMDDAVSATLRLERENDDAFIEAYGLGDELAAGLAEEEVTLLGNPRFRYGKGDTGSLRRADLVRDLVSYGVGCMFGRYSLDEKGLILADQGATLEDYLARAPTPTFVPDQDNVVPMVDGDWFEDDIVARFRAFLRVAFGEEHFDENLQFVTAALGVKDLRDYFVTKAGRSKFYDDHVHRYKKRPIYWLFSSPTGSFNALVYMHRYTPSTVSTVLTYLREYATKLESSLQQAERAGNGKEADRIRKILIELNEYEHDTLYPKASENVVIDLDDGVKVNYPKFGTALKKVTGLESAGD
ncbi:BREX-1 system adenine-specific DNA-methyltransferase PglX [Phycicoccus sp. KQZ13P-1]|uniref:BREX-1 system adenine-specific DNA-methyltransferase PglX n=1 Tax=Phycicoccus mangrovi TaxID=2840470 RepID=UPI001BFFF1CC|nr:BREX-1 system adenine-specific DNA-methyltransferase PglX [Phycicoccus mangrovi]MBT9254882.1 BREX-1 system adenine-specific DNA-methyltransferase PglX [Phycicoccus mangrovi]